MHVTHQDKLQSLRERIKTQKERKEDAQFLHSQPSQLQHSETAANSTILGNEMMSHVNQTIALFVFLI